LADSDFQIRFRSSNGEDECLTQTRSTNSSVSDLRKASLDSYVETARERHGEKIDALQAAFDHRIDLNVILQRRGLITDPEQRFFLALLLNVDGKSASFRLSASAFLTLSRGKSA
jgi:hypothetical protein